MSVPYMTPDQLRRAKRLIKAECCNYDAEHNECFALDEGDGCVCVQSISYSLLCSWFREAVLPLDEKLMMEILPPAKTRICQICGRGFIPKSNRASYCPECAKTQIRKKARERMRRNRESKQNAQQTK